MQLDTIRLILVSGTFAIPILIQVTMFLMELSSVGQNPKESRVPILLHLIMLIMLFLYFLQCDKRNDSIVR